MIDAVLILFSNIITALAYYILTWQLIVCARSTQFSNLLEALRKNSQKKSPNNYRVVVSLVILFPLFIIFCGNAHALAAVLFFQHDNQILHRAQTIMMFCCAFVSISTAIGVYKGHSTLLDIMGMFEVDGDGRLQHVENYLVEVVELVKESVIVLSDDLKVQRSNETSKALFGTACLIGDSITQHIHPEDLSMFTKAVQVVREGDFQCPAVVEYRLVRPIHSLSSPASLPCTRPSSSKPHLPSSAEKLSRKPSKVHITEHDIPSLSSTDTAPTLSQSADLSGLLSTKTEPETEYVWVESTICKGMRLNQHDDFEYDLKMVTRNIDDRKKLAQNERDKRESEEQTRINAAKLRYLSCIAHDLKTPLQSFCYTMDLLVQTALTAEQREFVQQATVAVDLMKLTISQTMDISKALTGAKLMPRRTTVSLSNIVERVKVIINGYGKQVPVSFEVAKDVCDTIITDEEWLWQMMLNLLTNACKYTDRGEIRVCIRTAAANTVAQLESNTKAAAGCSSVLLYEVIDTGVGVNSEKMDSLFDAFSQVQTGQVTGTGLGLFSVRTRAEGLGGSCGARPNSQSSTGTGTVIWFTIPYVPDVPIDVHYHVRSQSRSVARPADYDGHNKVKLALLASTAPLAVLNNPIDEPTVANASELARHTEEYIRSQQLTAMVVDDTLTVRKLMERVLLKMGFVRVECYENGSKGLEAMMAQQVDIVFSDVQMPIMTGPEMVARFRAFEAAALLSGQRTERQLVVAVTANGSQAGASGSGGFDEICPKPLSSNDIHQVIHKYL